MNLFQAFQETAQRDPERTALLEEKESVTYAELRDRIGRLSHLYQNELAFGARVALLSRSGSLFAQTIFALSNSGNPVLALDPKDTDANFALDLRQLSVKALLVSKEFTSRAQELLKRENLAVKLIEIERKRAGEYDPSFHPLPDRPVSAAVPVLILRQEDLRPERKYCFFSHEQMIQSFLAIREAYSLSAEDRLLTTMHWSHPFALTHGLLLPLLSGATSAVDPESETVDQFLAYLRDQKITRFAGPPRFYYQLLKHCAEKKYTLPGVKSITIGIGSIPLALRKTYKLLQIPVVRCYGRSEAIWPLAMDHLDEALDVENARSHPVRGADFAVLTADGDEIPGPGRREGQLKVRSSALAQGYFHPDEKLAEERTQERFQDGWLLTDELARLEGEGKTLTIAALGKLSDMLLEEGVYLSPRRLDDVARKLEGVVEAAGFVRFGREHTPAFACAMVVQGKRVDEKALLLELQKNLPAEYRPETLHLVNQLPRDAFDSVNRRALQRQFSSN